MHIVKPDWLRHTLAGELRDHEVYSCDVSPDGKRLVTAAGDSYVRLWSTESVYRSLDGDYTGPKQLAALSNHSGTIHSVRFSPNNKYLASGADDKIVCIYGLDPTPPAQTQTFGSNEAPPVENWRVLRRLVGHDNDVQDIAWSYDSSILISVGLDSKVVVWSGHSFEKLKTLSQHQSHVKGITFDPAGKYFATCSDDRTIKIFRFYSPPPNATAHDQVSNFMLEQTISAPFIGSPLTTYFRRCSWSPDGLHIAAANAMNGPVSSVAIITRGTWDSAINFIGHEGPVEVCSFCPRIFHKDKTDPSVEHHQPSITVVACGGQDKSLSIWNTSLTRPQVITQALSGKPISDLCWSPDGEKLFVTTLDGGILTVIFEPGELGYVAPLIENDKALSRYGAGRKAGIVEGPEALLLEEFSKADELKGVQGRMGELMGDSGTQIVVNGNSGPTTNGTTPATNGTSNAMDLDKPSQSVPEPKVNQLKQRVEIVGGKKRVKPLLISATTAPISNLPQTQLVANTTQSLRVGDGPHAVLDLSKPYDGLPKGGLTGLLIGNKRKWADITADEEKRTEKRFGASVKDGAAPLLINGENGLVPPSMVDRALLTAPPVINPALVTSQMRLATPVLRSVILRTADGSDPAKAGETEATSDVVMLEARNATGPSRTGRAQDRDPTRINCTKQGISLWQDYLPRPVSLVTGNSHFWAAGCEDGSLYVWTPAGRRLLNAFILEAQPVIMDCRGWWLMAITAVGQAHVWNIKTLSSPHPPVSLAPIFDVAVLSGGPHLSATPGIAFGRLNSNGRIIVGMTNGDGYSYNPGMFVWQRLSEQWFAVGSQYWNTTDSAISNIQASAPNGTSHDDGDDEFISAENISAGIIPLLERNTTAQTLLRGRAYFLQRLIKQLLVAEGFEGFEANVSVAHLENRLAAAMALGAKDELKIYLMMYAKRIGAEGLKAKIEELLRTLLGDIFDEDGTEVKPADVKAQGWNTKEKEILGWNRMDLLRDVVLILGKHRDIQRLTVPYSRLLGVGEERLPIEDANMKE
ncbi:Hira-domain-containing protein [Microthyrium microscopicum]|uniref:Protein HIR n=1 Tax=Microthyrium microscopicum TaxID=703497 RepID=A0A6A6U6X3_9PEZI|nr:Hira-domain-containing protein [Microthyrium microscopicum]